MANRIIASETAANGEPVDVTPEAINSFYLESHEIKPCIDNGLPTHFLETILHANTDEEAPVLLTVMDTKDKRSVTKELNEKELADAMLLTIVQNHCNIDDTVPLKEAVESAICEHATKLWEENGYLYTGAVVKGFGFFEENNEELAAASEILCDVDGHFVVKSYVQITNSDRLHKDDERPFRNVRFHFLPEGRKNFLTFSVDVPDRGDYVDLGIDWPEPSKEVPAGDVPKNIAEYESKEAFVEAAKAYIQAHMSMGNDKRIELEDDLIF